MSIHKKRIDVVANYLFKLRLKKNAIREWSARYPIDYDVEIETLIAPRVKACGYFLRDEFIGLCHWKTPRSQRRVASNPTDYIEAVTQTALSTTNERLRIEVLLLLNGVRWPTASVILHFCHADPYPILDVRALWSLSIDANAVPYNFEFWNEYTQFCRKLAKEVNVIMIERTADDESNPSTVHKARLESLQQSQSAMEEELSAVMPRGKLVQPAKSDLYFILERE